MLVERDQVIPIATDVDALDPGLVPRARLKAADLRERVGEQRVLEGLRDRTLLGVENAVLLGHPLE